jgi:quercetin dioxygenase-like cupin family protein
MASAYHLLGSLAIVHVTGDETDGRFCLVEFRSPADDMTPLHVHREDSQTTYVLEGEVTFYLPGIERTLVAGECIHQPAGVAQTERMGPSGARMLDVNSPAGFERFVAAVGEPTDSLGLPAPAGDQVDLEALVTAAGEHGVDILGPPGELP